METTKQTNLDEMLKCLEALKYSELGIGSPDYFTTLQNLCDTVNFLADSIGGLASNGERIPTATDQIIELAWQIGTLSEVIKKYVANTDVIHLEDLLRYYTESITN